MRVTKILPAKLNIGDTKMEKEKDMMNPLNWGVNEIKDACEAFLLSLFCVFAMYITLLIFR